MDFSVLPVLIFAVVFALVLLARPWTVRKGLEYCREEFDAALSTHANINDGSRHTFDPRTGILVREKCLQDGAAVVLSRSSGCIKAPLENTLYSSVPEVNSAILGICRRTEQSYLSARVPLFSDKSSRMDNK